MRCLICMEIAERFPSCDQWEERVCPQCGHYKISIPLITAMVEQGQIFDRDAMRAWLTKERVMSPAPVICFDNVLLVGDVHLRSA